MVLGSGSQTLHVTFTPTDTTNCPVKTTTVTEVVNPAVLTVTANNQTMYQGGTVPTLTDAIKASSTETPPAWWAGRPP